MTFEFDSDDFLTDHRGALEADISKVHGALLARAWQIDRDCHELLFAADIGNCNVQHLAPLFVRAQKHDHTNLDELREAIAPEPMESLISIA